MTAGPVILFAYKHTSENNADAANENQGGCYLRLGVRSKVDEWMDSVGSDDRYHTSTRRAE